MNGCAGRLLREKERERVHVQYSGLGREDDKGGSNW